MAEDISADAVTGDLRTVNNSLSFWRCEAGTKEDVDEVALAIAAAGDRIERLDIVWLSCNELRVDCSSLKDTRGRTPVADLAERHIDVCELNYGQLGTVALGVAAAIKSKRFRRLTKAHIKKLLLEAKQKDRFDLEDLSLGLRKGIEG